MEDPDYKALTSMHFYAWQAGLKTGIYYLRRKAKHQAQQFTIQPAERRASTTGTSATGTSASASATATATATGANASANASPVDCEMCSG